MGMMKKRIDEENLYDFLLRVSLSDKSIREYFVSEKRDDKN